MSHSFINSMLKVLIKFWIKLLDTALHNDDSTVCVYSQNFWVRYDFNVLYPFFCIYNQFFLRLETEQQSVHIWLFTNRVACLFFFRILLPVKISSNKTCAGRHLNCLLELSILMNIIANFLQLISLLSLLINSLILYC